MNGGLVIRIGERSGHLALAAEDGTLAEQLNEQAPTQYFDQVKGQLAQAVVYHASERPPALSSPESSGSDLREEFKILIGPRPYWRRRQ